MFRYGFSKSKLFKYTCAFIAAFRIIPGYCGNGDGAAVTCMNILIALRSPGMTLRYYLLFGRFPNYLNPKAESEKMQWRKAFDRNPLFAILCDKIAIRDYAAARAPKLRFPELHWSGHEPNDMPLETIPLPFIIKPNNRSGAFIIVTSAGDLDKPKIVKQCREWMAAKPYGNKFAEWGYSQVESRILIEEFLCDGANLTPPPNYELFVFNGRVGSIYFSTGRLSSRPRARCLYTSDWEKLPVDRWRMKGFDSFDGAEPRPKNLDAMIDAAERISAEVDYARVDMYNLNGEIYLGEVTPYPNSGLSMWVAKNADLSGQPPREMDDQFGDLWKLPSIPYWTLIRRGLLK